MKLTKHEKKCYRVMKEKYAEIKELEKIIKFLEDCPVKSPFNPDFFKLYVIDKLKKRLYRKKRIVEL